MELRFSTASNVRGLLRYNDDDDDDVDASGIWVGIARAQIRQLKMDLGIDTTGTGTGIATCNCHMVLLLSVTKCGHVKVMGGSGIYSSSPCWTWELGVLFGWSQGVFG